MSSSESEIIASSGDEFRLNNVNNIVPKDCNNQVYASLQSLKNFATECDRYCVSDRATAALASSLSLEILIFEVLMVN